MRGARMDLKVSLNSIHENDIEGTLKESLKWIEFEKIVLPGARVFIKPNLTYPFHKEGVTTSPKVIEALVSILSKITTHITVGESDGGSNAWSADEAFKNHLLLDLRTEYGIDLINLSNAKREMVETAIDGKRIRMELPSLLLHETDVFITLPVPKIHVMTDVSLAFKNQWGCIPDVKRLRFHPDFNHNVLALNKILKTRIAVYDGTYFLDRNGPMEGDPIPMNLIIAANDPGAGDLVCCEIMGRKADKIGYLKLAQKLKMMPSNVQNIELNNDLDLFKKHQFRLEMTFLKFLGRLAFNSHFATKLGYDSVFAKKIHDLLYILRGRPQDIYPQW